MQTPPRIAIIGAGFAGLAAARNLRRAQAEVILVDRRNYHLFQPLLYQVATAALSPAQIAQPIRAILRKQRNSSVILAEVTSIDTERKVIHGHEGELPYDYLIVATGATHTYFGKRGWAAIAPGIKSIEDATAIRRRILDAFEQAEITRDEAERGALLTFVLVGAGPTGVEMAGSIAELARHTLAGEFRRIDTRKARIVLVEAGPRILSAFPESLSQQAQEDLQHLGVEVLTGKAVTDCNAAGVMLGDDFIPSRTIIWAAGVKASPAAQWLDAPHDRAGRVLVAPDLSVPGHPDVFVIGDTASVTDAEGKAVPGLAPAAEQQGAYVADVLCCRLQGRPAPRPFVYKDRGTMATIGRGKAVADLKRLRFDGFVAWLLWGGVHLLPLVGFRNRFIVAMDWLWSYLTHARGVRLITIHNRQEEEI